jgi:DNA-directed RNA polymerase specialized sigma subunit
MAGRSDAEFPDRARFFAYASRAMRGLVIDYARRRSAKKRGRQYEITLIEDSSDGAAVAAAATDLPALGEALAELTNLNPALAELVDLHFFGGFAFGEIAQFRGVSERTVQRDWRKAGPVASEPAGRLVQSGQELFRLPGFRVAGAETGPEGGKCSFQGCPCPGTVASNQEGSGLQ